MFAARPLRGLPPYGPRAQSFPRADAFSEGFVVEFFEDGGEAWVGNFAMFREGGETSVHTNLGAHAVVVVAGGSGYLVDAEMRRLIREIEFDVQHIWYDDGLQAMIISNGLWFEAFDAERVLWRSRRFSWDGIQNLEKSAGALMGEALDPMTHRWLPFRLSLETGEVEGGSYNGPDM